MNVMVKFLVAVVILLLLGIFYKTHNNNGPEKKGPKTDQTDNLMDDEPCKQVKNLTFPLDLEENICTIHPRTYQLKQKNNLYSALEIFAVAKPETVGTLQLDNGITFLELGKEIEETKIPTQPITGQENNVGEIPAQIYFPHPEPKGKTIKFVGKRSLFSVFLNDKRVEKQLITGDLNKIIRFAYPIDLAKTKNYIGVYDYQTDILEVGCFDLEKQVSTWITIEKNVIFSVRDELLFSLNEKGGPMAYNHELKSVDHPFINVFKQIFKSPEESFTNLEMHPNLPIAFAISEQENEQILWLINWQDADDSWAMPMLTAKEVYGLQLSSDLQWIRFETFTSKSKQYVVRIKTDTMNNNQLTKENAYLLFQNPMLLEHDGTEIYSYAWIGNPTGLVASTREGSLHKWLFPE